MLKRIASAAAVLAVAACAGMESAGRNASQSTAAAPVSMAPDSAPAVSPPAAPATGSPAPAQSNAPIAAAAAPGGGGDNVVVQGARERQVPAPGGDPRSNAERMEDIRSWDRCVMRVQSAAEADPMRPQLTAPEEYCSQSLGMASRTSVPQSRLERR